ncbi:hypothetical protein [Marinisporobacter balticus]|uniref:Uncharacterized protein n=1 Tax=Marinisporobacter balticus TaxID=2018667 RepID=A0A4R2KVZ9_9FIRM|nr:hypothetical protein [Marinisporobacter balticus]TCO78691.1 hypothetical protein EV214_10475 [Marinisporobacter balticus]
MCIRIISLSIRAKEVLELLIGEMDGDLIHYEYHEIEGERGFGNAVFEKFYTSPKHKKIIIVNTQNLKETTNATIILACNYDEWSLRLDSESADECMDEIMEILDAYMINEKDG